MKKHISTLKLLVTSICFALTTPAITYAVSYPGGFDPISQKLYGSAWLSFDQAALATLAPQSGRIDEHGQPGEYGRTWPTADVNGQRLLYVQKFTDTSMASPLKQPGLASDASIANGTADPEAVEQWRLLNPSERVPLAVPTGGWEMVVDPWESAMDSSFWGPGYTPSAYSPYPNSDQVASISLSGNMRFASDFHGPSGSIWMRGISLSLEREGWDPLNPDAELQNKWYLNSSLFLGNFAPGRWFELKDPVFGTTAEDGLMTLDSEIMLGDAGLTAFLGFDPGIGAVDTTKTIGRISINLPNPGSLVPVPVPVPVPAAVWLFGSALLGLTGFSRPKIVS